MSMNVGTDYTNYKTGYTNAENQKKDVDISEKNTDQGKTAYVKEGVVYDKSGEKVDNSTYSINKMSATDRAAIVDQLKEDARQREQQLVSIVHRTIADQAGAYGKATGNDIWTLLSGGKVTVTAAEKAQAQRDISEDGYYGVKQTSQRLFDFACALAGDDVDKMKEMQKAMEKGFKQATKTWGRELPAICKETMNAANKLFEEYYKSKDPGAALSE
jgi:hypothetical protein